MHNERASSAGHSPIDTPRTTWPLAGRTVEVDAFTQALASPTCSMVVLYGEAGVGKTTLADLFVAQAVELGHPSARILASAAAAAMPLSAIAPVLPADVDASSAPGALFAATREAMTALGEKTPVLLVDDAHNLDPSSAVLLTQLVAVGAIKIVATIRDGETLPDVVAGWWRSVDALRIDVGDLSRSATAEVLEAHLAGPVGADTVHALYVASNGNPLVLRELVHLALVEGRLLSETGTWRLIGPLPVSRRLSDLLNARIAALPGEARAVLDQLALCGPLGAAELVGDAPSEQLHALERAGLVREVVDGLRHQYTLSHPLYGEVLRADMTATSRRAILLDVADSTLSLGARRREDPRRVATWRLDGGGDPDPVLLLEAALVARHANDLRGVERLATSLHRIDPTAESAILLGEARSEFGDFEGAEAVLSQPVPPGTSLRHRTQLTTIRAKNVQWGLCDWQTALQLVRAAQVAAAPEVVDDLTAAEASMLLFSGHPQKALDLLDRIDADSPAIAVQTAIDRSPALALVGRPDEAIAVSETAFAAHLELSERVSLAHPGTHVVNQAFGLIEAGRLVDARDLSQAGYEVAVSDHNPVGQIWFAIMLGKIDQLRGRVVESRAWYREGASTARLHRYRGPLRLALAGVAAIEANLGQADAAAAAVEELDALPEFGFLDSDQAIGRAWAAWAAGRPVEARAIVVDAADRAATASNRASAAWLWHDASRLGATDVSRHLDDLARDSDSALIRVRALHVAAVESGDPDALSNASLQLELLGLDLVAAEAASSAADAFGSRGDRRAAAREASRSEAIGSRCQGARTPGLVALGAVVPLSKREREVATLASQGLTSREIADRLFLSIRTVDNHLQRVYSKLGVSGRDELAAALEAR